MVWLIRILIAGILAILLAVLHYYSPLKLSSVVPYAGFILVITGLICLIHPLKTIFVRSRKAAACLIAVGFFGAGLALFWPASTTTVSERTSLLDGAMPQYEFVEHHQIRVHAPVARAYSALQAVTPDELAAYSILMKVRNAALGRQLESAERSVARDHCHLFGSPLRLHADSTERTGDGVRRNRPRPVNGGEADPLVTCGLRLI